MSAPYPVRHVPHAVIATRDGLRLSAALFLPDAPGDGPFPAALDAVPYRKDDDFRATDWDTYAALAALGVACVRLDLRGTGSSEGVLADEYTAAEHDDCEDAIAWIAAQPWCNGRVGMTGVSWGGFNAVQVAMRRPAALGAIAPIHWSADRYGCDVHMVGGTLQALELVEWPGGMVVENALPPRRAHVGDEAFERLWRQRLDETPQWPLGPARAAAARRLLAARLALRGLGRDRGARARDRRLARRLPRRLPRSARPRRDAAARRDRAVGARAAAPRLAGAGARPPRAARALLPPPPRGRGERRGRGADAARVRAGRHPRRAVPRRGRARPLARVADMAAGRRARRAPPRRCRARRRGACGAAGRARLERPLERRRARPPLVPGRRAGRLRRGHAAG